MGLALATVKWRLYRARSRLQLELTEIFGQEIGRRSRDQQRSREKVMAALPLVAFFRREVQTGLPRWWRRALAGLGVAGALGVLGVAIDRAPLLDVGPTRAGTRGFRVAYEPQELPAMSFSFRPSAPQPGQQVALEVAGFEPEVGERAYLHYITDLDESVDRVVEMRSESETWVAELTVPTEAANIFFYVDADREPLRYDWDGPFGAWYDNLRRYSNARMVYDGPGRPVRGAEFGLGRWAAHQERPSEEILAHYDRELGVYPDHWEVYPRQWSLRQRGGELFTAFEEIQREKEELRQRFPDDPDLAQLVINQGDTDRLRAFAARFPEHENAAGAAYHVTSRPHDDWEGRAEALQRFLRDFPESPYVDDAYRDLLKIYDHLDRDRGKALADSLIRGDLVPFFDLEQERLAGTILGSLNWDGAWPEGKAYSRRYRWYMEEGDTTGAMGLARRLARSELRDPIPFVSIGRQLAGSADHHSLAADLLESGLYRLTEENVRQLPTFVVSSRHTLFDREFMRRYRREHINEWRIKCLRELGELHMHRHDYRSAALRGGDRGIHGHGTGELRPCGSRSRAAASPRGEVRPAADPGATACLDMPAGA